MKDITRAFTLVSAATGLLLFLVAKGAIGMADFLLSILFIIVVLAALGTQWPHRSWTPEQIPQNARIRKLLSRVYVVATMLAIAVPVLSLATAYVLRVHAPRYIDEAIIITVGHPPASIQVQDLDISTPETKRSESYVAIFQEDSAQISPTRSVLQIVLGNVDGVVRVPAAWFGFIIVVLLIIVVAISEMLADVNMAGGGANRVQPSVERVSRRKRP